MSEDNPSLDLLLRWKEGEVRRESGRDTVSVDAEASPGEGELVARRQSGSEKAQESPDTLEQELSDEDLGDELFEWSADREQALIDALEETHEGSVPRVHQQLEDIANALQAGELQPERAAQLLTEVDTYLATKVAAEKRKVTVAHQAFVSSRADKLNALFAWQESATALREYLQHGEAVQLKVAFYAAEQAQGFLAAARDQLMEAEADLDELEDLPDEPEEPDEPT